MPNGVFGKICKLFIKQSLKFDYVFYPCRVRPFIFPLAEFNQSIFSRRVRKIPFPLAELRKLLLSLAELKESPFFLAELRQISFFSCRVHKIAGADGTLKKDEFIKILRSSNYFLKTFDKNQDGIVSEVTVELWTHSNHTNIHIF